MPSDAAEGHCVGGDTAEALLRVAEDSECDLVVVGDRGMTGVKRFVLGSVPNKLSHHVPSSLLIVDTTAAPPEPERRLRAFPIRAPAPPRGATWPCVRRVPPAPLRA